MRGLGLAGGGGAQVSTAWPKMIWGLVISCVAIAAMPLLPRDSFVHPAYAESGCGQESLDATFVSPGAGPLTEKSFWVPANAFVMPYQDSGGPFGINAATSAELRLYDGPGQVWASGPMFGSFGPLKNTWTGQSFWNGTTPPYQNGSTARMMRMTFQDLSGPGAGSGTVRIDLGNASCVNDGADSLGDQEDQGKAGHPINTATGNFYHTQIDSGSPAGIFGMELARTYNSSDDLDSPVATVGSSPGRYGLFGQKWTSTFDVSVRSLDMTTNPFGTSAGVEVRFGDGRRVRIPRVGSAWVPPPELYASFVWEPSPVSQYRLLFSSGAEYRFNSAGRLASVGDGRGQRVQACPLTGTISSVRSNVSDCTAAPAWQINLIDATVPADGLVDQVTYPDGASVEYTYDSAVPSKPRLQTVTTRHKPGGFPPEVPGLWTFTHASSTGPITEIKRTVTGAGDPDPHPDVIEVANHYDANGRIDYQTLESGDHMTLDYQGVSGSGAARRRITTVSYCTSWNVATGACNAGPVGQPNETFVYAHDLYGKIREVTDSTTGGGKQVKTQWVRARLTQHDDRRNARSTGAYDATNGRVNQAGIPDPVTTGTTSATVSATYCGSGFTADDARVKTTTNAAGEVTTYFYGVPDSDPQCEASGPLPADGSLYPTKITDNNAKSTSITYSAPGLVDTVTDADGIQTRFAWDVGKRLMLSSTVGAVGGPTTYYGYDGWGNRKVIRTATGEETWTYYTGPGDVAATIGPLPGPTRTCAPTTGCNFPADATGLTGPVTIYQYFADTELRARYDVLTTGPPQVTLTTTFDVRYKNGASNCSGAAQGCEREETEKAPAFSSTDSRQLTTVRRYDGRARMVSEKRGTGTEVATTSYTYGPMGRVDEMTDPEGIVTKYFYDDDGNVTKSAVGVGAMSSHGSFTDYDLRGRVVRQSGADGDTDDTGSSAKSCTAYEYDQADRVTKKIEGVFDTTPGSTTCVGTARSKKLTTWFHYDKVGRVDFTVTDNDGTGPAPTWNPSGALTGADINDHVTENTYTSAGRLASTIEPPADATTFDWLTGTGKRTTTNAYYTNAEIGAGQYPGKLSTVTDPQNLAAATAKTEYDADGRVAKQTLPGGDYSRYVHAFTAENGRLEQVFTPSPTGSGEAQADTRYTLTGWVQSTTEPYSGSPTATSYYAYYNNGLMSVAVNPLAAIDNWVFLGYDSRGNRTSRTSSTRNSVADPVHTVTEAWTYDKADRELTAKDSGGTNTWTTTYYSNTEVAAGQVPGMAKTVADPSGRTETRTYWNSGLPKSSVHTQSGQPTVTVDSWWSAHGQRLRTAAPTTGAGQVNTDYTYDAAGRLTQMVVPSPNAPGTKTSNWTWSLSGNQTAMKYPFATSGTNDTAKYTHDALDRLKTVQFGNGTTFTPVGTYDYNANNQITDEAVQGYGTRKWYYPANSSSIPNRYVQTFGALGNTDTTLTWKHDGRIEREVTGAANGAGDRRYTYDTAGQLACRSQSGATCPGSVATDCTGGNANLYLYRYDPRGQRLCKSDKNTITNYTYNADNTGRLATSVTGAATTNYAYDQAGRRTGTSGATVTTTTYDTRGLPKTVVAPPGGATGTENRRYDGEGRVVYSERGGNASEYTWDPTQPIEQVSSVQAGFVLGLALQGHKRFQFNLVGGVTIPYTYNWHGDVVLNSTGGPADYDPYGTPFTSTGTNPDPWNWYGAFTYQGELSLQDGINLRARTYHPQSGQFTSRDPLDGVPTTTTYANKHAYADNDPMNKVDPTGLRPEDVELGALPCAGLVPATRSGSPPNQIIGSGICLAAVGTVLTYTYVVTQSDSVPTTSTPPRRKKKTSSSTTTIPPAPPRPEVCRDVDECDVPVFMPGGDTPDTTRHIDDAIAGRKPGGRQPSTLNYAGPGAGPGRGWTRSDPRCSGRGAARWCDEYPFQSTLQAGPGASLELVPAWEQRIQSGKLSSFYSACRLRAGDEFLVTPSFAVPETTWMC